MTNAYIPAGFTANRNQFESLPTFLHLYRGQAGFLSALRDVFGPHGARQRLRAEMGETIGGGFTAAVGASPNDITGDHFITLYGEMGETDRLAFREALRDFIARAADKDAADLTAFHLARIQVAVDFGTGALEDAALIIEMENSIRASMDDAGNETEHVLPGVPMN